MLSNDSEVTLADSPIGEDEARQAELADDYLDPRNPIEVASGGSGTTNDPPAVDKPPGTTQAT